MNALHSQTVFVGDFNALSQKKCMYKNNIHVNILEFGGP